MTTTIFKADSGQLRLLKSFLPRLGHVSGLTSFLLCFAVFCRSLHFLHSRTDRQVQWRLLSSLRKDARVVRPLAACAAAQYRVRTHRSQIRVQGRVNPCYLADHRRSLCVAMKAVKVSQDNLLFALNDLSLPLRTVHSLRTNRAR